MSSSVASYHGHMAGGARLGALSQVLELAAGVAPSIHAFQAWKKTWGNDRPTPRPLERSP